AGCTMPVPVGVLRLPRGPPDGYSRGFATAAAAAAVTGSSNTEAEVQQLRALLRQRFLRALTAARNHPVRFWFPGGLRLEATFRATDSEPVTVQVDELRTPLGVQAAALLRCGDLIAFDFHL
ncbi:GEMI7 protein, partial [Tricholaema leucomelas]|nr:GEMI7 protein [Tricholaema leucomelas]